MVVVPATMARRRVLMINLAAGQTVVAAARAIAFALTTIFIASRIRHHASRQHNRCQCCNGSYCTTTYTYPWCDCRRTAGNGSPKLTMQLKVKAEGSGHAHLGILHRKHVALCGLGPWVGRLGLGASG